MSKFIDDISLEGRENALVQERNLRTAGTTLLKDTILESSWIIESKDCETVRLAYVFLGRRAHLVPPEIVRPGVSTIQKDSFPTASDLFPEQLRRISYVVSHYYRLRKATGVALSAIEANSITVNNLSQVSYEQIREALKNDRALY